MGAAEVEEVVIEKGEHVVGEISPDGDRGEAPCPAKPDYEPRAVGEPLARGERA